METAMKTLKRLLKVFLFIIVIAVVGYFIYTGKRI